MNQEEKLDNHKNSSKIQHKTKPPDIPVPNAQNSTQGTKSPSHPSQNNSKNQKTDSNSDSYSYSDEYDIDPKVLQSYKKSQEAVKATLNSGNSTNQSSNITPQEKRDNIHSLKQQKSPRQGQINTSSSLTQNIVSKNSTQSQLNMNNSNQKLNNSNQSLNKSPSSLSKSQTNLNKSQTNLNKSQTNLNKSQTNLNKSQSTSSVKPNEKQMSSPNRKTPQNQTNNNQLVYVDDEEYNPPPLFLIDESKFSGSEDESPELDSLTIEGFECTMPPPVSLDSIIAEAHQKYDITVLLSRLRSSK